MKNNPFIVEKITKVITESEDSKTFVLPGKLNSKPGQFVMLWLPGAGEKPISLSGDAKDEFSVTVCAVGPFSKAVNKLTSGDKLGFCGPFGTHFKLPKDAKAICLVGGGYGSAPLAYLAEVAIDQGVKVFFIEGARSKTRLLFTKRMREAGAEVLTCTDDGSEGPKCYSPDVLKTVMETHKIDKVFTCGPEIMMKKVIELAEAHKIPSEVSMERHMKCGIGLCGQCAVDDLGICLCQEGPIISGKLALSLKEFGEYSRDSTGKKIKG